MSGVPERSVLDLTADLRIRAGNLAIAEMSGAPDVVLDPVRGTVEEAQLAIAARFERLTAERDSLKVQLAEARAIAEAAMEDANSDDWGHILKRGKEILASKENAQ